MPDAVSNETNDDLHAELSAEFDRMVADDTPEAPEAAPAAEAPAEAAPQPTDGRRRDEQGRFVKGAKATQEPVQGQEAQAAIQPPPTDQTQLQAAQSRPAGPPPGWSVAAKAEFDKLSPAIKEAIAKREEEVSNGFAKMQSYKGLDPYVERAARSGTNLAEVTRRFFAAEDLLATDFLQGTLGLCQHFNVDPNQLAQALLGQQGGHQQHAPQAQSNELYAIRSELAHVKAELQSVLDAPVQSEVQAFFADPANKYAENVRGDMQFLLANNRATSLKDAYEKACKSHPEISEQFINERLEQRLAEQQRRASEARRASGSLNPGSPIPGGANSGPNRNLSVRDELLANWDAHAI